MVAFHDLNALCCLKMTQVTLLMNFIIRGQGVHSQCRKKECGINTGSPRPLECLFFISET